MWGGRARLACEIDRHPKRGHFAMVPICDFRGNMEPQIIATGRLIA